MSGTRAPVRHRSCAVLGAVALVCVLLVVGAPAVGAAATVSGYSPARGAPTTVVTVDGTDFTAPADVSFTDGSATEELGATLESSTELTFAVPVDAAAGGADFQVEVGGKLVGTPESFTVTGPLVVTTTGVPATEVSAPYSTTFHASGGVSPYKWSVVAGSLPSGFTLSSGGVLAGTAVTSASTALAIGVTDHNGVVATVDVTLVVGAAPQITTRTLPRGRVGANYLVEVAASGGTPPYSWSIPSGGIPGGLLLNSGGELSGRPGVAGTTKITLRVSDALGASASRTYAVVVAPNPVPTETLGLVSAGGELVVLTSPGAPPIARTATHLGGVTALVAVPDSAGYWVVSATGQVRGIDEGTFGRIGVHRRHRAIVAAVAESVSGYWLVSASGQVYAFGSARNYGSLERPGIRIVAAAAAPGGRGYWLVSASGQVFAFGSAYRLASLHDPRARIVAIAPTSSGRGCWLLGRGGEVYTLGTARALGSLPRRHRGTPVAIAPTDVGTGYWIATRVGALYGFGSARALPPVPAGLRIVASAGG